jgi:ABC-type transport system involved in cytochrome bd biosynthesis fused ATPase/permease subunit
MAKNLTRYLRYLRRRIEKLGPYPSLFLLAVPLAVVEPLKLATLFMVGSGHWITGSIAMLCAYAVSLLLTHVLFKIVKAKLLTLPWFAALWTWFVDTRDRARNACAPIRR